jgi:hypothetical protein
VPPSSFYGHAPCFVRHVVRFGPQQRWRRLALHALSPSSGVVRPRPRRSFQLFLHLRVSAFLIFIAIPARFRTPCASASASALHAPPSPPSAPVKTDAPFPQDGAGSDLDPSPNGAVRIVHHSCDAPPPFRLLTVRPPASPRGEGDADADSEYAKDGSGEAIPRDE